MSAPAPTPRTRAQLRVAAQNAATAAAIQPAAAAPGSAAVPADSTAFLIQLLQQQQLQAALANANAELAAAEALAQQRRASAGPPATFNGVRTSDELAVNTWLDAMESWFTLAHIDADADSERIEIAAAAFRGSAQQWWAATRAADAAAVAAGGTTAIDRWSGVMALLRKHYLPQDPARWAIQQLSILTSGNNADVQLYTNRFLQFDLMIVGPRNELERLTTYEQGLPEGYRVKSAEKQHATLAAAIASTLALWNAKSIARGSSHSSSRQGSATKLNNTQVDFDDCDDGSDGDTTSGSQVQITSSAAASASRNAIAKLEQKLDAFISSMQGGEGYRGRRRERQRQKEGARSSRSKTPGISDELAKQRLQTGVCIKCGEKGHFSRECTNSIKTN